MKVTQTFTQRDYREFLDIKVESEQSPDRFKLSFHDGEPEDNSLCRNFNDCYTIVNALQLAYKCGLRGEEFNLECIEKEDDEE
jgi:hypothetical protein